MTSPLTSSLWNARYRLHVSWIAVRLVTDAVFLLSTLSFISSCFQSRITNHRFRFTGSPIPPMTSLMNDLLADWFHH